MIGDPASLPAINSLLAVAPTLPATIWFETTLAADQEFPFRINPEHHDLRSVPRTDLVEGVKAELPKFHRQPGRRLRLDRLRHGDDPDADVVRAEGPRRPEAPGQSARLLEAGLKETCRTTWNRDRPALVSAGTANSPAVDLYTARGCHEVARIEIAPGVTVTQFSRPS